MRTALIIFLSFVFGLVMVDVLWLNSKVINLEQVAQKIQEQINFLAVQQETPKSPAEPDTGQAAETEIVAVPKQVVAVQKSVASEVFIPLGSGSTSSTEWIDTGAQAYVDKSIYPRLQEVYLQASLKANSGTVFARLGGAEISHNTPTSTFKTSALWQLADGNRLYVVQIRSENGQEVFLENARLRLVLK